MAKKKQDIEVVIIYDSREQDVGYLKDILDSRVSKDGIKFVRYEKQCVKPNGCEVSTGDITIEYRIKDSKSEWIKSNLCLELKKGMDAMSSTYMKANRDRLFAELQRGKDYGLDFYFIITDDLTSMSNKINKIQKFRNKNIENTYFEMMMKLDDELKKHGFNGVIVSGSDLAWCIKRVIKWHIKKNKLQYF